MKLSHSEWMDSWMCLASNTTMCAMAQPCFLWPTTALPLSLSPQSRKTDILQLHPWWEAEEERLQHMLLPSTLLSPFMSKLLKKMGVGSSLRSLRGYGIEKAEVLLQPEFTKPCLTPLSKSLNITVVTGGAVKSFYKVAKDLCYHLAVKALKASSAYKQAHITILWATAIIMHLIFYHNCNLQKWFNW